MEKHARTGSKDMRPHDSSTADTAVPVNTRRATTLTAIILTFNEHLHIRRCIENVRRVAGDVVVVDSGSTDDTVSIARALGASVLTNSWVNHATQFNWALEHAPIGTEWVMRVDADEYLDEVLLVRLPEVLAGASEDVKGFIVKRPTTFLGQRVSHGGMSPWLLRIWRYGAARCESRWMDEHMVLVDQGEVQRLPGHIVDYNLNSLTWWADKHNRYSSREALDLLLMKYGADNSMRELGHLTRQAAFKRMLKEKLYIHLPLGLRPWLYFFYRLILRGGVLDGYRGVMFHTLQGFWYRLLVDAKVMQIERLMWQNGWSIEQAAREVFGIELDASQTKLPANRAKS